MEEKKKSKKKQPKAAGDDGGHKKHWREVYASVEEIQQFLSDRVTSGSGHFVTSGSSDD